MRFRPGLVSRQNEARLRPSHDLQDKLVYPFTTCSGAPNKDFFFLSMSSSRLSLRNVGSKGVSAVAGRSLSKPPSSSVVNVVRNLRRGDFPGGVCAFKLVSPAEQAACPALHEALVLACAHVPDAHAASAVLSAAPSPTLAAFSHCATAYIREQNPDAAVSVLEQMASTDLPLDPRIIDSVERVVRRSASFKAGVDPIVYSAGKATAEKNSRQRPPRRPRAPSSETSSLLLRLERLSALGTDEPGLATVSLDPTGFFDEDGGDVLEWISSRNNDHEISLSLSKTILAPERDTPSEAHSQNERSSRSAVPAYSINPDDPLGLRVHASERARTGSLRKRSGTGISSRLSPDAALRNASGSLSRLDSLWNKVAKSPELYAEPTNLAAAVSAYLKCGWKGSIRAVDVVHKWLGAHASEPSSVFLESLSASPTRRAMLLTAATSALSASASSAPRRALAVADTLAHLSIPEFRSSLPLSGAIFKVLRHSRLSLPDTLDRLDRVREHFVQLDEQSFSLGLSAILECSASPAERWSSAKKWLGRMRLAGVPLTHHTYSALASQLRFLNNPEITTSLLRDMASAGVKPTPRIYGTIFDSCIASGHYTASSRRRALPSSSMLSMLRAVEGHMALSGVCHSSSSRFALSCALAHLGEVEEAMREFTRGTFSAIDEKWSPSRLCREYNRMIFNFAHCRCATPDGPAAAFLIYDLMREAVVVPTAKTLEYLLAACVRLGDHYRAINYVKELAERDNVGESPLLLERSGIESLLAVLEKCANLDAWHSCRTVLCASLSASSRKLEPGKLCVAPSAVELAVIAFARRGHRDVCEEIISLAGVGDLEESCWKLMLDGKGDFERVRRRRQRRLRHDDDHEFEYDTSSVPNSSGNASIDRGIGMWSEQKSVPDVEPLIPNLH